MAKQYFGKHFTSFVVEFEKLFDDEELEKYKYFVLSPSIQRSYIKQMDLICDNLNKFLNGSRKIANDFLYNYLSLKKSIDSHYMSKSSFINFLISNIYNPALVDACDEYVNGNYDESIYDDFIKTVSTKNASGLIKIKEETLFTHEHIKTLYQISIMIQLFLPMTLHYLTTNKCSTTNEIKYFINEVVEEIFKIIKQSKNMDLYSKLYVFVAKMVRDTEKSDRLGWVRQSMFGETQDSVVEEVILKLLISMIPKFDFDNNIINYMSSVTRSTIEHTLRKKDPYEIGRLNIVEDSNDDFDNGNFDVESVENVNNRKDERKMFPRMFLTDATIEKIAKNNNIYISEDELAFYYNSITDKINELQKNLLCQVFSTDFSGSENIISCDKSQFTKLIIILFKLLKRKGLDELAYYVVAKKDSYMMNRYQPRALNKKLLASESYQNLIETKYRAVKSLFTDKFVDKKLSENPFIVNLMIILNNNFIFNVYGDPRNGTLMDKKDKEDLILEQLITVCRDMID